MRFLFNVDNRETIKFQLKCLLVSVFFDSRSESTE